MIFGTDTVEYKLNIKRSDSTDDVNTVSSPLPSMEFDNTISGQISDDEYLFVVYLSDGGTGTPIKGGYCEYKVNGVTMSDTFDIENGALVLYIKYTYQTALSSITINFSGIAGEYSSESVDMDVDITGIPLINSRFFTVDTGSDIQSALDSVEGTNGVDEDMVIIYVTKKIEFNNTGQFDINTIVKPVYIVGHDVKMTRAYGDVSPVNDIDSRNEVHMIGFTITGDTDASSHFIRSSGTLYLRNCWIKNNTLSNCIIRLRTSDIGSGTLYMTCCRGSNNLIEDNTSQSMIRLDNGTKASIESSLFSYCESTNGGLLYAGDNTEILMNYCDCHDNAADDGSGGVLYAGSNTDIMLKNSVFTDNYASSGGGVVYIQNATTFYLTDNTVTGNVVDDGEYGAVLKMNGVFYCTGNTFTDNTGGLLGYGDITVSKCLANTYEGNQFTCKIIPPDNTIISQGMTFTHTGKVVTDIFSDCYPQGYLRVNSGKLNDADVIDGEYTLSISGLGSGNHEITLLFIYNYYNKDNVHEQCTASFIIKVTSNTVSLDTQLEFSNDPFRIDDILTVNCTVDFELNKEVTSNLVKLMNAISPDEVEGYGEDFIKGYLVLTYKHENGSEFTDEVTEYILVEHEHDGVMIADELIFIWTNDLSNSGFPVYGDYTVTPTYVPDNNYGYYGETTGVGVSFTLNRHDFTLEPDNISDSYYVGGEYSLSFKSHEVYNQSFLYYDLGLFVFNFNGETVTSKAGYLAAGNIRFLLLYCDVVMPEVAGVYPCNVSYLGGGYLNPATASVDINVVESEKLELTVESIDDVRVGDTVDIVWSIYATSDQITRTIKIPCDIIVTNNYNGSSTSYSETYTCEPDIRDNMSISFTPSEMGSYTVRVNVSAGSYYSVYYASMSEAVYFDAYYDTKVTILSAPVSEVVDNIITVKGQVETVPSSSHVVDGVINLLLDTKTYAVSFTDGSFTVSGDLVSVGGKVYTVAYVEQEYFRGSSTTFEITVEKHDTSINVESVDGSQYTISDKVEFKGCVVTSDGGSRIPTGQVVLTLPGDDDIVVEHLAQLDSSGCYSVSVTIFERENSITVDYLGDAFCNASSKIFLFNATKFTGYSGSCEVEDGVGRAVIPCDDLKNFLKENLRLTCYYVPTGTVKYVESSIVEYDVYFKLPLCVENISYEGNMVGDSLKLEGYLTSCDNIVTGKTVSIKVNNVTQTTINTSDTDGKLELTYPVDHTFSVGGSVYTVTFICSGGKSYVDMYQELDITVQPAVTVINYPVSLIISYSGYPTLITGYLCCDNDEQTPIKNKYLTLEEGDGEVVGGGFTNNEGKVTVDYARDTIGQSKLYFHYHGDVNYAEVRKNISITTLANVGTYMTAESITIKLGESVDLKGFLYNNNNIGLSDKNIQLKLKTTSGYEMITTITTDSNGMFSYSYQPSSSGTKTIKAVFNAEEGFKASSTVIWVYVEA